MAASDNRSSPVLSEESVLTRCRFFTEVHLWERRARMDGPGWLSNFRGDDLKYGLHLLNAFVYFSAELVERLFVAGFQTLSQHVIKSKRSFIAARGEWRRFSNSVYIVHVTGERPSNADSGHIFARMARERLHIPEERLLTPAAALECLLGKPGTTIVFVDDFIGSGQQFMKLWYRSHSISAFRRDASFAGLARTTRGSSFFYCPLVCTTKGHQLLGQHCREVVVRPAHLLPDQYSVLHPDSLIWPAHLRPSAYAVIKRLSEAAGIPDTDGAQDDWRGFHKLSLALAFAHGMPDASLPLFTWNQNGWKPLLRY